MSEKEEQESVAVTQADSESEATVGTVEEEENERKHGDTKVGLTLRILVAGYVLYLDYGLIQGFGETSGNDRILIGIAIVFFLIAGGAILFFSARKLIRKEYVDAEERAEEKTDDKEK